MDRQILNWLFENVGAVINKVACGDNLCYLSIKVIVRGVTLSFLDSNFIIFYEFIVRNLIIAKTNLDNIIHT